MYPHRSRPAGELALSKQENFAAFVGSQSLPGRDTRTILTGVLELSRRNGRSLTVPTGGVNVRDPMDFGSEWTVRPHTPLSVSRTARRDGRVIEVRRRRETPEPGRGGPPGPSHANANSIECCVGGGGDFCRQTREMVVVTPEDGVKRWWVLAGITADREDSQRTDVSGRTIHNDGCTQGVGDGRGGSAAG